MRTRNNPNAKNELLACNRFLEKKEDLQNSKVKPDAVYQSLEEMKELLETALEGV